MMMVIGRRAHYEILKDEVQKKQQKQLLNESWFILAVIALVGIVALHGLSTSNKELSDPHQHTIPTLLSVVHHETGEYLMALENPLYQRLKRATFRRYDNAASTSNTNIHRSMNIMESPTLQLDRSKMGVREPLTLTWTMGKDASGEDVLKDDDIIVLYCGNHQDSLYNIGETRFLEAATIVQARATSQRHNGGILNVQQWKFPSFPVLRQDFCQFHLYQAVRDNNNNKPIYSLLDTSNIVQIESSRSHPTAIHLAVGNDPSEMVVQFITGDPEGTPVARYSKQGSKPSDAKKASGNSHTYTANDMCGAPANITEAGKFQPPGMIHMIRLTDLEPNTLYEYKVGLAHGQGITWSDSFTFTSAQATGDGSPFTYLVYGDQGCPSNGWGEGSKWVAAMTEREVSNPKNNLPIRAVHVFGDLTYSKGAAHIWDEWLQMISSFSPHVPLMVGNGNHEYCHTEGGIGKDPSGVKTDDGYRPAWGNFANWQDSGGECAVPLVNHFTMPNSTNSNGVFWYSFDFGNVHTIVTSSEHDLAPGSPQHQWLEEDLQSVDRKVTPWLVLEIHRPLYESQMNWGDNAVGIVRRMELDELLAAYNVDLVLGGHYHSYLRTCDGLRNSKCNNGGPTHITVGSAGAELTLADQYSNDWTEKLIREEYGYGRITVANASAMLFEFVKAGDKNDETAGQVQDSVWIRRER